MMRDALPSGSHPAPPSRCRTRPFSSKAARRRTLITSSSPTMLKQTNRDWARDHTLRSAFRFSVLWYYQTLARRAGLPVETRLVQQFHYGNENTRGGLDKTGEPFWVDGTLRISANEQVEFLRRFHEGRLGLFDRTTRLTKDIMVAEEGSGWRLSAKTGACHPTGEKPQTGTWDTWRTARLCPTLHSK